MHQTIHVANNGSMTLLALWKVTHPTACLTKYVVRSLLMTHYTA
jgi:hypothetical protein